MTEGDGISQRRYIYKGPMDMDNRVGIDYGSRGAGWVKDTKGKNCEYCNGINNKIFLKRC